MRAGCSPAVHRPFVASDPHPEPVTGSSVSIWTRGRAHGYLGHRRRGHRDRVGVRLHQRLPRHGQRHGHLDRDRGAEATHAVLIAGILNLVGAFLSVQVAKTISSGLVDDTTDHPDGDLRRAWSARSCGTCVTWLVGLPSSSSHALIGGLIGATWVAAGADAVNFAGVIGKVLLPAVLSPIIAGLIALIATYLAYRITARGRGRHRQEGLQARPDRLGLDGLARPRHQRRPEDDGHHHAHPDHRRRAARRRGPTVLGHPLLGSGDRARHLCWVGGGSSRPSASASATIETPQGFAAETSSATVILASSHLGFPLSTTQVATGSIFGAGAAREAGLRALGHRRARSPSRGC